MLQHSFTDDVDRERLLAFVSRDPRIASAHIEHNGEPDPASLLYIPGGFDHPRQVRKYMRRWPATS